MLQGVIHYLHASIVPKDEIPTSIKPRTDSCVLERLHIYPPPYWETFLLTRIHEHLLYDLWADSDINNIYEL